MQTCMPAHMELMLGKYLSAPKAQTHAALSRNPSSMHKHTLPVQSTSIYGPSILEQISKICFNGYLMHPGGVDRYSKANMNYQKIKTFQRRN